MPKISKPADPKPSADYVGPNFVESIDPRFGSPLRNDNCDVGSTTRVAGKTPVKKERWPWE